MSKIVIMNKFGEIDSPDISYEAAEKLADSWDKQFPENKPHRVYELRESQ
jgi:hypothetical protein